MQCVLCIVFYALYGYSEGVKRTLKLVNDGPTDRPTNRPTNRPTDRSTNRRTEIVLYRAAIADKNIETPSQTRLWCRPKPNCYG